MQNFSILCRKTKTFIKIDNGDKSMFFEAFILCGIYRLAILIIPFNKLKRCFGMYNSESPENIETEFYKTIKKIDWAVEQVSMYTPWQSKCLVQALTAQRMLKRRKIHSTLYLGVAREGQSKINAHAWLRSGRCLVTGGIGYDSFTQVAKFASYEVKKH